MIITLKVKSFKLKFIIFLWALCSVFCVLSPVSAKIYIDITSPAIRQLPISIATKGPPQAKEIEWIIHNDLEATGMFSFVDPDIPGAEIIAHIDVAMSDELKVILSITDLVENREVLKKRLVASKIRSLAHTISNDIYKIATGKKGIFRTKLSYLVDSSPGRKELHVMDWDGYSSIKVVAKGLTSSHTWSHDGNFLIYSSERNRRWTIYLRNRKYRRETVLFSSKGLNLVGGTSPEELIVFSSSKDGSSEIYMINIYGKDLKKLTRSFGIDVSPVFSPDSKRLPLFQTGEVPRRYI